MIRLQNRYYYEYDENSRMKARTELFTETTTLFFWDESNRLIRVESENSSGIRTVLNEYSYYPGSDLRVKKRSQNGDESTIIYEDQNEREILTKDSEGSVKERRILGNIPGVYNSRFYGRITTNSGSQTLASSGTHYFILFSNWFVR